LISSIGSTCEESCRPKSSVNVEQKLIFLELLLASMVSMYIARFAAL